MKRSLKRILPILLSLLVVCSIIWYLFVYDRSFTQDILLQGARYFEENGNHSIATWFYHQAYLQSGSDDEVIIELAQRFKADGNYTKAEVTLSNAIENGGSVELYIALCKTYVEQDKMLDAANMLNSISDPTIKSRLDALRPATPAASVTPGFYSKYMTIQLTSAPGSTLYVTSDGTFPSIHDTYSGQITLSSGETTIRAIAVGENGLVSEPAYLGYTVGGVIEEVSISDPVLNAHIRTLLGVSQDAQLFTNDLWQITSLTVPEGVSDYSDIGKLSYLQNLVIQNADPNIQQLSAMGQLKTLDIRNCSLTAADISAIGKLSDLENLVLQDCGLSNIEGLSTLSKLNSLDLSRNAIRDVTPLSFMSELTALDLSNNALGNLSALSNLKKLEQLNVSNNSLTSLAPLSTCSALSTLRASGNQLTSFPTFLDTKVLSVLDVSNNDLSSVADIAGYKNLTSLDISSNDLTSILELGTLTKLETLNFSRNQVAALPNFSKESNLISITGSHNALTSIAPLSGLSKLNYVTLEYNNISNINALAKCSNLVQVDVFGNPVKNVSAVTDEGIIVNYDPT